MDKRLQKTKPYIPGSFDRPPRNPALKINSGYKAWEFLLLFYGLGPCLLHGRLPTEYWINYCQLVRAVQILLQDVITVQELKNAYDLLLQFQMALRIFIWVEGQVVSILLGPSSHGISHLPHETIRMGPGMNYSQWGMERTIGNLGEEIRQHKDAFANLSQRAIHRC